MPGGREVSGTGLSSYCQHALQRHGGNTRPLLSQVELRCASRSEALHLCSRQSSTRPLDLSALRRTCMARDVSIREPTVWGIPHAARFIMIRREAPRLRSSALLVLPSHGQLTVTDTGARRVQVAASFQ